MIAPALAAGALSAAPAPAARAASRPAAARAAAGRAAALPARLSAAQAAARAKATGQAVVASALTTPTSVTKVSPNGLDTLTQTLKPVRAWRGGAWHALDARLHVNPDRTVSPAVTTGGIELSGGGRSPLAVLTSAGRKMSLFWPGQLPVPTLSGATASYANVLPGVNLAVTVSPQGGFSDVLIIRNAAAAANRSLTALRLTAAAPGLHITKNAAGNLTVATGPRAEPVFTTPAPTMWDSAAPRDGTRTVRGPDGTLLAEPSGALAYSSATGPGVGAATFRVPVSLSGHTITVRPARAGLTGRGIKYPVYIDPDFISDPVSGKVSDWTQVDSGFPSQSYLNETSDLQVGECDNSAGGCDGLGVARSFVRMPISSELTTSTSVNSADLSMDDVWSDSCTAEPVQLWTTGGLTTSTDWSSQPAWDKELASKSFAFGFSSGCGSFKNDVTWDVTSTVQADAGTKDGQTFGLRAGSETTTADWKQFASGTGNVTLSTSFHSVPTKPASLTNSPAGACTTSSTSPVTIGNDDVTLSATVGDTDDGNGDASLSTAFVLKNQPSGSTAYSTSVSSGNVAGGTTASVTIPRATMQGLNASGSTTPFTYSWTAVTKDAGSPVLTSPTSQTCYFTYNPAAPASPGVTLSPASATGPIGSTVSATFTQPTGCGASSDPCPSSYTYQIGVAAPVTVAPDNSPATGDWTGNITLTQFGPDQLAVYGTAAGGNIGSSTSQELTGTSPATPFADGYFTGGSFPSLLSMGTGKDPSLWLSAGTGNGTLAPAIDIGSMGTAINPGTDGPADWAGAQVLHGNLTGRGLQDVMAYYPAAGDGVIIAGSGAASPLTPVGLNAFSLQAGSLTDPTFASPSDSPVTLVAAGNASELCASFDDLIGVVGDATSGYELDLFTTGSPVGFDQPGGYAFDQVLSATAPDGTSDWQNYALATAQPADSSDQTGCATGTGTDPDNVSLFALDKATGALYISQNPNVNASQSQAPATATPVGSGNWTKLSVPWGSAAPSLVSADVNHGGSTELWTLASGTATPYTLSGATLSKEGSGAAVATPAHDWALNDGGGQPGVTTATDSTTGQAASLTGTYSWLDDDFFGTVLGLDGSTSYLTPPTGIVSGADPALSLWFRTGSGGVLASLQSSALSSAATTTGSYDPVMYVGTDGKLRALWYQGASGSLVTSKSLVNDDQWHHAVLSTSGTTQTLTIDGVTQGTATGTVSVSSMPDFDIGAGYIGGHWPDEPHSSSTSGTGFRTYFAGAIADVTYSQ
jgi:hypothetical protein